MPRTNNVTLIQVDVKRYDDLDAIEDKIEVGSYKGKTLYIGREVYHEVVCGSYVTHVLSVGLGRCLMIKDTAYLIYYEETTCIVSRPRKGFLLLVSILMLMYCSSVRRVSSCDW